MQPYIVLQRWRWKKGGRYAHKIGKQLVRLTLDMGFEPLYLPAIKKNDGAAWFSGADHAEVRMTAVPQSEGTGWHQDGDTTVSQAEMDFGLVLWASRDPTQLKAGSKIYQPKPFELIYVNNLDVFHRRPPGLSGRRWHFRQRVVRQEL